MTIKKAIVHHDSCYINNDNKEGTCNNCITSEYDI